MTNDKLIQRLQSIVGRKHLKTGSKQTERFRKGWRSGKGDAIAVVIPGSLLEMWHALQACVAADKIVIMQAANTGLTEGSAPNGTYDRDVVVFSTLRLDQIHLLDGGEQIISLPGGTLFKLEKLLAPFGRQPHSVIGSSCIGASILGGVCNNSGGSLVRRGPAYTELSLFAQLDAQGNLHLVNHLGIDLGDTAEDILRNLQSGNFDPKAIHHDTGQASQSTYGATVSQVDADTPARFNADPNGLFEASGCAGKLAVFAVRLDTFADEGPEDVYYIGTNDTADLTALRRGLLQDLPELPVSGEYIHKECYDISRVYGKDTLLMIHWFGTDKLPFFFAAKGALDARLNKLPFLPQNLVDRIMQGLSRLVPEALPKRMQEFRKSFDHHLILKVSRSSGTMTEQLLTQYVGETGWFKCNKAEAGKAMLHRFAAAGAAVRMQAVNPNTIEDTLALDIALRRNDDDWFEKLPDDIEQDIVGKLYYGHFLCHVFHQDYLVRKGADPKALKARMLEVLDQRGAEYPAEHNVGHLYVAKPALVDHYKSLDPTNSFNPGIGKTTKSKHYGASCCGGVQ